VGTTVTLGHGEALGGNEKARRLPRVTNYSTNQVELITGCLTVGRGA